MSDNPSPTPSGRSPVLNTSTLVMGPTRSGKSSLLATFAEWVWTTHKLITVYASIDDGGFPTQMQALINRGIVWYWKPKTRSAEGLTHETLQRMAQGWLPRKWNPKTGEVEPNVELVPPVSAGYTMKCGQGHVVKTVSQQSMLTPSKCPSCGAMVDLRTAKIETTVTRTKGFEKIGAMMFDGISSASQWGLEDLSRRDLGGEKSAMGGAIASGNLTFGQNNRAQVGFTQNRAHQLVSASNSIPGLVVPPIWTALTQEGSDEGGLKVRGPLIAGQAVIAVAPQWFGDVIEIGVVAHDGKNFRRMYLQSFVDGDGVRHLCGVRSYPGLLPSILEDEDTDDPTQARFQNFNLGKFYELREAAAQQLEADYAQKFPDAPGLPEMLTFGEAGAPAGGAGVAGQTAPSSPAGPPSLPQGGTQNVAPVPPPPTPVPPKRGQAKKPGGAPGGAPQPQTAGGPPSLPQGQPAAQPAEPAASTAASPTPNAPAPTGTAAQTAPPVSTQTAPPAQPPANRPPAGGSPVAAPSGGPRPPIGPPAKGRVPPPPGMRTAPPPQNKVEAGE